MAYSTAVLEWAGEEKSIASWCTVTLGVIKFLAGFALMPLIDRHGRRPLLIWGAAVRSMIALKLLNNILS